MFVFCIHVVFLSQCFVKHFLFFSSFLLFISLLRLLLISLLLSSQHSYFLSLMIIFVNLLLILFPPSLALHPFLLSFVFLVLFQSLILSSCFLSVCFSKPFFPTSLVAVFFFFPPSWSSFSFFYSPCLFFLLFILPSFSPSFLHDINTSFTDCQTSPLI